MSYSQRFWFSWRLAKKSREFPFGDWAAEHVLILARSVPSILTMLIQWNSLNHSLRPLKCILPLSKMKTSLASVGWCRPGKNYTRCGPSLLFFLLYIVGVSSKVFQHPINPQAGGSGSLTLLGLQKQTSNTGVPKTDMQMTWTVCHGLLNSMSLPSIFMWIILLPHIW